MNTTKEEVIHACLKIINEKIKQTQTDLKKTQDAANNETKSSMGDKYETGRAMAQNEKQKLQLSLSVLLNQKKTLSQIKTKEKKEIEFGSLVKTDLQTFFISVPLGQLTVGNQVLYALSPVSPMGKALIGKVANDKTTINGKKIVILEVNN